MTFHHVKGHELPCKRRQNAIQKSMNCRLPLFQPQHVSIYYAIQRTCFEHILLTVNNIQKHYSVNHPVWYYILLYSKACNQILMRVSRRRTEKSKFYNNL